MILKNYYELRKSLISVKNSQSATPLSNQITNIDGEVITVYYDTYNTQNDIFNGLIDKFDSCIIGDSSQEANFNNYNLNNKIDSCVISILEPELVISDDGNNFIKYIIVGYAEEECAIKEIGLVKSLNHILVTDHAPNSNVLMIHHIMDTPIDLSANEPFFIELYYNI